MLSVIRGSLKDRFHEAMKLHRAGSIDEAEAIYRDLLRENPEHAGAWHLLGVVLHTRHKLLAALEHIEKALSLCDSKAIYWNNYGAVLKDLGRHAEAKSAFEKSITLRDHYPEAWANLGLTQLEAGELSEAENSLRYALRLDPRQPDALRHLAVVYREKGNLEEALRLCRDAVAVASHDARPYETEASVLAAMNRVEPAVAAYKKALACNSRSADTFLNQGFLYTQLDETDKAKESFRQAAHLRPERPTWALRHLNLCPVVFQSASEVSEYRAELERQLDEALAEGRPFDWRRALHDGFAPPFQLSHHGVCNRQLREKYASLFSPHFPQQRPEATQRRRIRVGFTCTRSHEGGFVRGFGGIMEQLDRRQFEVVGLVSRGMEDACKSKVRADDIKWIGFPHHMGRIFQLFSEVNCDIVMHWQAGTDTLNYFLPFLPFAPVQCIGFGMHGTTGIRGVDYFVSSELFEHGPSSQDNYTETLVQFAGATAWQTPPPRLPGRARRADFGLPDSGTLYFCPQRHAKFHPDFDRLLRQILDSHPSAWVVILEGRRPHSAQMLKERLARTLGSTLAGRVAFLPSQDVPAYYRLLSVMDVLLDTPTYSASLTGYDAFAFGIPVVTLPGDQMVQRYAAGLYRRMGVGGTISTTEQEYVDLAVRLGREPEFRRSVGDEILSRNARLFEDKAVVREYEEFFSRAVRGTAQ